MGEEIRSEQLCPSCGSKSGFSHYYHCEIFKEQRKTLNEYLLDPQNREILATAEELLQFLNNRGFGETPEVGRAQLCDDLHSGLFFLVVDNDGSVLKIKLEAKFIQETVDFIGENAKRLKNEHSNSFSQQMMMVQGDRVKKVLRKGLKELYPGLMDREDDGILIQLYLQKKKRKF